MAGRPKRRQRRKIEEAEALRREYLRQARAEVKKRGSVREGHLRRLTQSDLNGRT